MTNERVRVRLLASLLVLGVFSFALVFGVGGATSRTAQSYHGLHHSAYVVQILAGISPPTNPSSLGAPVNFYWAWHAMLAAGVRSFGRTPFEMALVSNALGLWALLGSLWWIARRASSSGWIRLGFCLLPFLLLNPIGLTQFALRVLVVLLPESLRAFASSQPDFFEHLRDVARHHTALQIADHNLLQLLPQFGFLEGVPLSDRAGNLINKFFNFNSFPLAFGLYAMAVAALRADVRRVGLRGSAVFVAALGAVVVSPLVAVALGVSIAADAFVRLVDARSSARGPAATHVDRLRVLAPGLAGLAGVLLSLPHLLPILGAYGGETRVFGGLGVLAHARFIGWALLPSLVLQAWALARFGHISSDARSQALAGLGLALAAMVLSIPVQDPNEYKFALLATLPTTLLAMALWRDFEATRSFEEASNRRLRAGVAAALVAAGLAAVGVTAMIYRLSPWSEQEPYAYAGQRIELRVSPDEAPRLAARRAAYAWLLEHTVPSDFVMERPVDKDALELSVVAQRRVVAALPSMFTGAIPHHARLVAGVSQMLGRLAGCDVSVAEIQRLFGIPAPWPDHVYALVSLEPLRAHRCDEGLPKGVTLVFANEGYAIYRVEPIRSPRRSGGAATRS